MVVVSSPGEDWEGLGIVPCTWSRCGGTCLVTELQRRDVTSWRVTSEIAEIRVSPIFSWS